MDMRVRVWFWISTYMFRSVHSTLVLCFSLHPVIRSVYASLILGSLFLFFFSGSPHVLTLPAYVHSLSVLPYPHISLGFLPY